MILLRRLVAVPGLGLKIERVTGLIGFTVGLLGFRFFELRFLFIEVLGFRIYSSVGSSD